MNILTHHCIINNDKRRGRNENHCRVSIKENLGITNEYYSKIIIAVFLPGTIAWKDTQFQDSTG